MKSLAEIEPETKTIVVFGPTTKNTEALVKCVADGLKKSGAEVTLKNVISADINELKEYDAIVFVCTLKGVGKLQDDSIDLYADMKDILLAEKKHAVFRTGIDQYPVILPEIVIRKSAT